MNFYTIGVYNSSEEEFFGKLINNNIDTFCDIRQRRGVRGAKYSFVNSIKLQRRLKDLNINYQHILELAPTKEIRDKQKEADIKNNIFKRNREELGPVFKSHYKAEVISRFNFLKFFDSMKTNNAENIVLFCVEERPKACHRSLVAQKIEDEYKLEFIDL
ncbi:DUF488 domain-containing protein [Zobellia alginiliquefaciens]|uniref:DUF488 domain-containing protein n=1 Tax=Zobellia alginiliquefaciens TaxID=3032586 RepID=UPI0023E3C4A7|nr:DUF488 domain-containing protein [Zobellia alginiliquefaciens]